MGYLSEPKDGWFIPITFAPPEEEKQTVESQMRDVLDMLGPASELAEAQVDVLRGEWQGGEGKVGHDSPTQETFLRLSESTRDGPVILMLHGGGHITGSPAMERTATFELARMCHGRVFAVDFRLAPQHPFPAALIDAIIAYKYLVQPPAGSWHTAVDPSKLIIAGDSSGVRFVINVTDPKGGLAISLMIFLIYSNSNLPLPAGVLTLSPLFDVTGSFPSTRVDTGLDWLPCLYKHPYIPKPSPAWPPAKPRFDFYTDIPLHPLVQHPSQYYIVLTTGVTRVVGWRTTIRVPAADDNDWEQ